MNANTDRINATPSSDILRLEDAPPEWGVAETFFAGAWEWLQKNLTTHLVIVGSYLGNDHRVHPFRADRMRIGTLVLHIGLPDHHLVEYECDEARVKDRHGVTVRKMIPQIDPATGVLRWITEWATVRVTSKEFTALPGATNRVVMRQLDALVEPFVPHGESSDWTTYVFNTVRKVRFYVAQEADQRPNPAMLELWTYLHGYHALHAERAAEGSYSREDFEAMIAICQQILVGRE